MSVEFLGITLIKKLIEQEWLFYDKKHFPGNTMSLQFEKLVNTNLRNWYVGTILNMKTLKLPCTVELQWN